MDKQQREYIHHLMLQYSDAMVRLTYRRVGDWHLAEDLVQETFLTACCKSERVCGHKAVPDDRKTDARAVRRAEQAPCRRDHPGGRTEHRCS